MISTREGLVAQARRDIEGAPDRARTLRVDRIPFGRIPLTLPPPADGCTYTRAEVAHILNVSEKRVDNLASTGINVGGETVRLEKLRLPVGRIAPAALCRFMERVNGVTVEVGLEGHCGRGSLARPSPA